MNIVDEIVPSVELHAAAVAAGNCQAKYDDLQERLVNQREIVNKLALELHDLVMTRKWENAESSEETAYARQECSLAAERYQEEQDLLAAIETAVRNTQADVSIAGNQVFRIISQLVSSQFSGAVIEGKTNELHVE